MGGDSFSEVEAHGGNEGGKRGREIRGGGREKGREMKEGIKLKKVEKSLEVT